MLTTGSFVVLKSVRFSSLYFYHLCNFSPLRQRKINSAASNKVLLVWSHSKTREDTDTFIFSVLQEQNANLKGHVVFFVLQFPVRPFRSIKGNCSCDRPDLQFASAMGRTLLPTDGVSNSLMS